MKIGERKCTKLIFKNLSYCTSLIYGICITTPFESVASCKMTAINAAGFTQLLCTIEANSSGLAASQMHCKIYGSFQTHSPILKVFSDLILGKAILWNI